MKTVIFLPFHAAVIARVKSFVGTNPEELIVAEHEVARALETTKVPADELDELDNVFEEVLDDLDKSDGAYAPQLIEILLRGPIALDAQRQAHMSSKNGAADAPGDMATSPMPEIAAAPTFYGTAG